MEDYVSREAKISAERYLNSSYLKSEQIWSLINQLQIISEMKPESLLEIGPGNGFVSWFLRKSGMRVTTFDINPSLSPDVLGNVIEIDSFFKENSFDMILCAEVLEHIPFEHFETTITKISKISKQMVLITLPRQHRIIMDFNLRVKIPYINRFSINVFIRIPNRIKWEGHHWEIDYQKQYSLKIITSVLKNYFRKFKTWSNKENRVHQFFLLGK